ncbi:MAG: aminoglycoside phosphotransferase family protein [Chloroflexi bacterium]|nr:aminoglycoside phosphotransferase family protein [Chloroflexota bacterium]
MPDIPDSSLDIPERYEDVTAEWLTQALRAGGVIGDQSVSSFHVEPIDASRSRASSLARIAVEYDGHSEGLPHSMFAKFVSRLPANRERADQRNVFRTEIALYQSLGRSMPMNMPRMYFGLAKEGTDVAVLLLEEIEGISKAGLPLAQEWSLTTSEAVLALKEVSKMHARWWKDPKLGEHAWLLPVDCERQRNSFRSYQGAWAKLRPVLEPALSSAEVELCDALSEYLPTLLSDLARMPVTLCHGDYHVGNLLWDQLGHPGAVWAVDWQVAVAGPVVLDVTWLLGIGVPRSDLHLVRQVYLPEYHRALIGGGVTDNDYEDFKSDYRLGLLNVLHHTVVVLAVVDLAREDSLEVVRLLVGNIAAVAVDAGCGELIA